MEDIKQAQIDICNEIIAEINADMSIAEDYFKIIKIINKIKGRVYNDN